MRKFPIVCLILSISRLISGKLLLSKEYRNDSIKMGDGQEFQIFRYIRLNTLDRNEKQCIFIVSFKFAHLSHFLNKLTSIIPMLMIAAYPGFIAKVYAVNNRNGHWQGMYQWESIQHLNDYKKSFVFRMMNRRAIPESISAIERGKEFLIDYIESHKIKS